jgi:hypothetical protein
MSDGATDRTFLLIALARKRGQVHFLRARTRFLVTADAWDIWAVRSQHAGLDPCLRFGCASVVAR